MMRHNLIKEEKLDNLSSPSSLRIYFVASFLPGSQHLVQYPDLFEVLSREEHLLHVRLQLFKAGTLAEDLVGTQGV